MKGAVQGNTGSVIDWKILHKGSKKSDLLSRSDSLVKLP